jgi:hypothetical protein
MDLPSGKAPSAVFSEGTAIDGAIEMVDARGASWDGTQVPAQDGQGRGWPTSMFKTFMTTFVRWRWLRKLTLNDLLKLRHIFVVGES